MVVVLVRSISDRTLKSDFPCILLRLTLCDRSPLLTSSVTDEDSFAKTTLRRTDTSMELSTLRSSICMISSPTNSFCAASVPLETSLTLNGALLHLPSPVNVNPTALRIVESSPVCNEESPGGNGTQIYVFYAQLCSVLLLHQRWKRQSFDAEKQPEVRVSFTAWPWERIKAVVSLNVPASL